MKSDISNIMMRRFSFIETRLSWTGEVHAAEVADYFEVARQTAQGFIDAYRKFYPGQLDYDPRRKRHVPSASFQPKLTKKEPLLFLDFVTGQAMEGKYWDASTAADFQIVDVDRLGRPSLSREIVQTILSGLSCRQRVSIRYQSKEVDPHAIDWRMISPNHLVHADNRYHVRAYCHKREDYRDFVLSRILNAELQTIEKPGERWVSGEEDEDWRTSVTLRFRPNPELAEAQIRAVTKGYELDKEGCYCIQTSRALAFYVKRRILTVDHRFGLPRWSEFGE